MIDTWPVARFKSLVDRVLRETGLSQAQLAALVPMDQSALSKWRTGSTRPRFESVRAMGHALQDRFPDLGVDAYTLVVAAGYSIDELTPSETIEAEHPLPRDGRFLCCRCLMEAWPAAIDDPSSAAAVTIMGGDALCARHAVAEWAPEATTP